MICCSSCCSSVIRVLARRVYSTDSAMTLSTQRLSQRLVSCTLLVSSYFQVFLGCLWYSWWFLRLISKGFVENSCIIGLCRRDSGLNGICGAFSHSCIIIAVACSMKCLTYSCLNMCIALNKGSSWENLILLPVPAKH